MTFEQDEYGVIAFAYRSPRQARAVYDALEDYFRSDEGRGLRPGIRITRSSLGAFVRIRHSEPLSRDVDHVNKVAYACQGVVC